MVKIEIIEGKSVEYKKKLLDIIHNALVKSIKIPDYDRIQRLYELKKENFEISPDKTINFTLIEIIMFKGRSNEAKKNLYQEIVKNLSEKLNIKGNDIIIVIIDPPLYNWGIRGGRTVDEVDLGFKIEV
ncbi:MAG: tautomerase family protein [Candidatus Lokiarchaeota archaeon]|nr:tautomerase family protein [Candidatus Lokiarchaeota archaeon]